MNTLNEPPRRVWVPQRMEPLPPPLGAVVHGLGGATMGTTWSVTLAGPPGLQREVLRTGIERVLAGVIAQMSPWEPQSDLSRYNRAAAGQWQALPEDFAKVMRCALGVAQRSNGAYDPTAGRLVNAWGFGPSPRHDAPGFAPPRVADLAGLPVGWSHLQLDDENRLLQPGGHVVDLSAIAKGFAVDAVAAYLQACGLAHHLVEIGGELRGSGIKPDGQPWWVALEPPAPDCGLAPNVVALHGLCVATSGDYRRCYTDQGKHRSHTIDPRTRAPVAHGLASVTVLHSSCMLADAWSTALMVLGPQAGLALAEAEGLAALLAWREPDGRWREALSSGALALSD